MNAYMYGLKLHLFRPMTPIQNSENSIETNNNLHWILEHIQIKLRSN